MKERINLTHLIRQALKEDIGRSDITTDLIIPRKTNIKAVIMAKESGVVCGLRIAKEVFKILDRNIIFKAKVSDADYVQKGENLAEIKGRAAAILTGERVALNFLGMLSGIATRTRQFVNQVRGYRVKILDTRKTIPCLRGLEKYAVKTGGGCNHRQGLDEMVLVKENHLTAISKQLSIISLKDVFNKQRKKLPKNTKIEIEVTNLKEFQDALELKPDIIMLDNMSIAQVKKAVQLGRNLTSKTYKPLPKLEVSGNVDLKNIRSFAQTGIDYISLGTLTKDIQSLDLSLEII